MKVMISQPMNGKSNKQILQERQKLIDILVEEGHEVVNTIFDLEKNKNAIHYLAQSINVMADVDAVIFMPGWEIARGCQIEHEVAVEYGKYIREVK